MRAQSSPTQYLHRMHSNPSKSIPRQVMRHTGSLALLALISLSLRVTAEEAPDPLKALNEAFRTAYGDSRSEIVKKMSPVIIQCGDNLVLIKSGVRTEAPALTKRYHELKSVAHVPLATYLMLAPEAETKLGDPRTKQLEEYRELVVKARKSIGSRGYETNLHDRQLRILDQSLAMIDVASSRGKVTMAELRRFARSLKDDILANAYDAAEDQIATMDRQFKAWQAEMTPDERRQLRVAVSSVHMARVGNLAMQYFAVALNEPFEGRFEEEETKNSRFRLLFTESVFDEQEILKSVATHIVDEGIGVSFFEDGQRMHRDLLADATEQIIQKRLGMKPGGPR